MAQDQRLSLLNHSDGLGKAIAQAMATLLSRRIFQVIGLHEGQSVAVEHEPDVDEEHPVARAAVEELLFSNSRTPR